MNPLQEHVEKLFAGYKPTPQVRELKAEILSNLEAKVADLTGDGMEYSLAVEAAKSNITSVEGLVEEPASYEVVKYRSELLQTALLYSLIAWIITIPMRLFQVAENLSLLLPLIAVVLGILYLLVRGSAAGADSKTASFNHTSAVRSRTLAWIIWGIFVLAMTMSTTAVHMGSNIWFGRPLHISGPYQFGTLAAHYAWPLVTIIIPLIFSASLRLKMKHEAGGRHVD
ncbi:hypothetical protein GRF59_20385 [Paenibacillus sp. HJL G12]|uniref:Uncharacterized protein n=1 Tax=Paenibacillus dendrobii TaxID=2691084 RepID=A0A7X3LJ86_9BACL|nr:hypothetical protein [Paenibacillus dendrobii]MWV45980.1 hypothetical protein [Paenibacillus dendrobii]